MSNFGIKVGKPGKRTPASADPRQNPTDTGQKDLIFNTNLLTFKYIKKGSMKLPLSGTVILYHGLNYPPSFRLFARSRSTGIISEVVWDAPSSPILVPYCDKQNLNIIVHGGVTDHDLLYFIGADNLEDQTT